MGYTTEFDGQVEVTPLLNAHEIAYLKQFSQSRRMDRFSGPYRVDGEGFAGQDDTADVREYNYPPAGQPGLWCGCEVCGDGTGDEVTVNDGLAAGVVRDMLTLAGVTVPPHVVWQWTAEQRREATDWAAAEHLSASDNDVKRLPKPAFLAACTPERDTRTVAERARAGAAKSGWVPVAGQDGA